MNGFERFFKYPIVYVICFAVFLATMFWSDTVSASILQEMSLVADYSNVWLELEESFFRYAIVSTLSLAFGAATVGAFVIHTLVRIYRRDAYVLS